MTEEHWSGSGRWLRVALCVVPVLMLFVLACDPRTRVDPREHGLDASAAPPRAATQADLFPDKAEIRYATGFTVSYHGNYKVVRAAADASAVQLSSEEAAAWSEVTHDVLVLVQRNTEPPAATGHLEGATFIEVPIRTAAVNRDADALRIKHLGFADRLIGIGGTDIYDAELRARVEAGTLHPIGSALHRTMKVEFLLTTAPEAIFLRIASLDHADEFYRLRDLGLASVPVYAWTELSGLARAEWLKYVALFFNAEGEARRQFDEIERQYEELKDLVKEQTERPKAVWAFSPNAGGWRAHRHGVEAGLMDDAGLSNVMSVADAAVSEGTRGHSEGLQISNEQFLTQAGEAEIWITWSPNDDRWPSSRYLAGIRAYREDRVYNHRKRRLPNMGADDWYELGQLRPDLILADLAAVAHPELFTDHELVFLQRLQRTKVHDD